MHSYSDGQSYSKAGCGQTNDEGSDALGKVVDGNGSSCTCAWVDMSASVMQISDIIRVYTTNR